jgi:hypothetical protein
MTRIALIKGRISWSASLCVHVCNFLPSMSCAKPCCTLRVSGRKFVGAFLAALGETPVFTLADATRHDSWHVHAHDAVLDATSLQNACSASC